MNESAQTKSNSSVGAVWPPAFATHNRLRGFYPDVVDTPRQLGQFVADFASYREKALQSSIDRLTIRYVGRGELLESLDAAGVVVEGVVPLACSHPHGIVYTCWNSPTRSIATDAMRQHEILLRRTRKERPRNNGVVTEARALGLDLHILSRATPLSRRENEAARFTDTYSAFGLGRDGVQEIVSNADNTIGYLVDRTGAVVCTVLAERAKIRIEGHEAVTLYEITEGITRLDFQGRGLYRALSAWLVDRVWEDAPEPVHAIYGECNLSSPGVIYAARQNGRRFVYDEGRRYGAVYSKKPAFGILSQNYKVDDGNEARAYNDFALSYVDLATRRI